MGENNSLNHKDIYRYLDKIIIQKTIANAYIFHGPEGVGKKKAAINFISKIIKNNNSDLNLFENVSEINNPDFILVEPTYLIKGNLINQSEIELDKSIKNKPQIRINQIREVRKFLSKKAIQSDKKCILITDAHLLNESASNCLLKTLEEPDNGVFILLTSKLNLILETITSRCHKIKFNGFTKKELRNLLTYEKNINNDAKNITKEIETLINLSNGSPGKLKSYKTIWEEIPSEIKERIKFPIDDYFSIFFLAKLITEELDFSQQEFLIEYIQHIWWEKTKDQNIIQILENIKLNLVSNVQPRLSWEANLLKIAIRDF